MTLQPVPNPLSRYTPQITVFIAVLVAWEVIVRALNIPRFLLPAPSVILSALLVTFSTVLESAWYTLRNALLGFALGCSAGILVALATSRWTTVREGLLPVAIAINSIPIIALAPIANNWFGSNNPMSKVMIVILITFFPTMINTVRGLTLVEPAKLELMRSYAVSELEVLTKVRIPNALPYVFNAFKVCSSLSLIGAIVAEYFGGPRKSLGVYILQEAQLFRFDNAWAAIIIASLLGIAFYAVVITVERRLIPWHVSVD
ncbi:MAG: ABC transporter permease [Thermoflexales bacterium]|nr:ABC transporter permease [Thermoflexales bacterium]MDW8292009.1 ABC transporter permease [Anaerolineae bacterium]